MYARRRFGVVVLGLAALVLLLSEGGRVGAAIITWGPATNITGDADVATTGTLFGALNIGFGTPPPPGVPLSVNGVPFAPVGLAGSSTTSGNFTFTTSPTFAGSNFDISGGSPYANLSSAYQTLLQSFGGTMNPGGQPFTLTIGGLTVGHKYDFEWWSNDSSADDFGFFGATEATAGNSVTLVSNTHGVEGALGQFAIGTFTADATTEVITFSPGIAGGAVPDELPAVPTVIDALQVRDVTPAAVPAVPEPSSLALLSLGGLALVGWRRWKKRVTA